VVHIEGGGHIAEEVGNIGLLMQGSYCWTERTASL